MLYSSAGVSPANSSSTHLPRLSFRAQRGIPIAARTLCTRHPDRESRDHSRFESKDLAFFARNHKVILIHGVILRSAATKDPITSRITHAFSGHQPAPSLVCHSERSEESLSTSRLTNRDSHWINRSASPTQQPAQRAEHVSPARKRWVTREYLTSPPGRHSHHRLATWNREVYPRATLSGFNFDQSSCILFDDSWIVCRAQWFVGDS